MPCKKERDRLVSKQRVGHRLSRLVTRRHQTRQKIISIFQAARAPLGDHGRNDPFNRPDRPPISEVAGQWNRVGNKDRALVARCDLYDEIVHRMVHVANVSLHLGIEERFGCDAQRQSHHLGMDVDDLPVLPAIEHLAGKGHHGAVVSKKLPAGEGRRGQAALTLPGLAFTGEQAFSEHRRHVAPEEPVLDVISMIVD
jgi:hypothetical protein